MRIVLVGDSLLMPRPAERIFYEDTYGYLVMKSLPEHEVIIRGRYSNDTSIQAKRDNLICDIEYYNPDVVIIQLGIVDCAPRIFSKRDCAFISRFPRSLKMPLIKFLSNRRPLLTRLFPKVYVRLDNFEANMSSIIGCAKKCNALPVIIDIAKTSEHNIRRSSNYIDNIIKYNNSLKKLADENGCLLIDLYGIIEKNPDLLWKDGIHLSHQGHIKLAKKVVDIISDIKEFN